MPSTRSSSPRVVDDKKRTRAQTEQSDNVQKAKQRKMDTTQSTRCRTSLSTKRTRSTASDTDPKHDKEKKKPEDASSEELVVKRSRGRPRRQESPAITAKIQDEEPEGDNAAGNKRAEKHKNLIEVEKRTEKHKNLIEVKRTEKHKDLSEMEKIVKKDSRHDRDLKKSPGKEMTEESGQDGTQKSTNFPATVTKSPVARKRGRKLAMAKLTAPAEAHSTQTMSHSEDPASEKSSKRQKSDKHDESKLSKISTAIQGDVRTSGEGSTAGLLSPRRSGRGMVPNSRFKDMHLFSTGRKHQTSSSIKVDTNKQKNQGSSTETAEHDIPARKKCKSEDSKLNMDIEQVTSEPKSKEKPKLTPFSSGASLAMAQAKVQQQTEAKTKAADKFSIKEIPEGLEVTGRDGIPVVVSAENIVRVPFPDTSTKIDTIASASTAVVVPKINSQETSSELEVLDNVQSKSVIKTPTSGSTVLEASDNIQAKSVTQTPTSGSTVLEASDSVQTKSVKQTTKSGSTVFVALDNAQDSSETPPNIVVATTHDSVDSRVQQANHSVSESGELSPLTVSDVCVMEEVIEADVISTNTKPPPLSHNQSRGDRTDTTAPVTSLEQGQTNVGGPCLGVDIVATTPGQSTESDITTRRVSDTTTTQDSDSTADAEQPDVDQHLGNSDDKMSASELTASNKSERADKNKTLPNQFLKDGSSLTPAKPGYIISPARRNSSVVKIVTLSSMLEGNSSRAVEKDEKEPGTCEKLTDSETLECLTSESSSVQDTEARPTGVDMILEGSKTVDAADTASSSESDDTPDSQADDSKFSSASTQTPIDRQAKTITPTIYKPLPAPTLRTISVNLGKHELQEGEVGYESPGPGGKAKSEEYILVELPEGATIQQRYVKSRTRIDDSMFLSSESMSQGVYHCTLCNYKTSKKPNWYKHKKKHLGLREYACTQCEYRAATSSNLKRHMAIHEDLRAFSCLKCSLTFRQKIHLERHIKYKHEEKQIKCPFCDYMCANENPDLKVHIKRKHLPGDSPDGTINAFACEECNLMTVSKRDLKQHMKFHRKGPELKLFCEHCSFVTDCESRLRRHVLIHTKEKPYQCGLCLYRGSQKEHVLRHMRSQHNIDVLRRRRKPLPNEITPVEGSQVAMKDISKLIDRTDYSTKDKIFACNHCTMKFSKLINLYKHLHTQHRNIMPSEREDDFSCVVCDFHTNTKKNLLVHMRKHNMTDHTPPSHLYSCVLCRYTNPKRRNLFQHMRKKHHIEIVMKDDGSTSCFVTDTSNIREDVDQNVLTVGDVVTATTADTDSQDDPTGVQGVISLEDLATIVTPEPNQDGNLIIDAGQLHNISLNSLVQQHEAAEAIEGLQALAGQINLADSVIEEVQVMDDPGLDPITMETTVETSKDAEEKSSIQLSAEQLLHLSSGDFVEINGEMYKVEITAEDSATATPTSLRAMAAEAESSHCQETS